MPKIKDANESLFNAKESFSQNSETAKESSRNFNCKYCRIEGMFEVSSYHTIIKGSNK